MKLTAKLIYWVVPVFLLTVAPCIAQTSLLSQLGAQPNVDTLPIPLGFVSTDNGNFHLEIPITTLRQRNGLNLTVKLTYDSLFYYQATSGADTLWYVIDPDDATLGGGNPALGIGWRIIATTSPSSLKVSQTVQQCNLNPVGQPGVTSIPEAQYEDWQYIDSTGAAHSWGGSQYMTINPENPTYASYCPNVSTTQGPADDGSGYYLVVTNYNNATVWDIHGNMVYSSSYNNSTQYGSLKWTDTNGNQVVFEDSTPSGVPTTPLHDELGRVVALPAGYSLQPETIPVNTNFQAPQVIEMSGNITVLKSLTLPDGSSYSFTYDSGTSSGHYGVMTSMTLPTGGTVNFQSTVVKNEGQEYGTIPLSQMTTQDGTWTYNWSSNPFTVTDPKGEQKTYNQQCTSGAYPCTITVSTFSGTASGSPLQTVSKTIDQYLRPLTVVTTLNNGTSYKSTFNYATMPFPSTSPAAGQSYPVDLVSSRTDYDQSGNVLRQINVQYQRNSSYTDKHIGDLPLVVSAGPSQTTYTYDSTGLSSTSGSKKASVIGSSSHDDADYGVNNTVRGNLTQTSQLIGGSSSLITQTNYYNILGELIQSQDSKKNPSTSDYSDKWSSGSSSCTTTPTNAYPTTTTIGNENSVTTYNNCDGSVYSIQDQNDLNNLRSGTVYSYDAMQRPLCTMNPDGGSSCLSYGGTNLPQIITNTIASAPNPNSISATTLDDLGRPVQIAIESDPYGADYVTISYDSLGRVFSVTNSYRTGATETTTQYQYDALNRNTVTTYPDGSSTTSLYSGPDVQITDQGNGTVPVSRVLESDSLGRLRSVCEITNATDAAGNAPSQCSELALTGRTGFQTLYGYDPLGNLLSVQQGTAARSFIYDGLSRIISAANPESGTVKYQYQTSAGLCSGNPQDVCQRTDARGITTTYTYDTQNRLTNRSYSDGSAAVAYLYDVATSNWTNNSQGSNLVGRLTGVFQTYNGIAGTKVGVIYGYDPMGRMTLSSACTPATCGNSHNDVLYTYDLAGNINTETSTSHYPAITFTYGYDGADHLSSIASSWNDSTHPPILFQANTNTQSALGLPPYLSVGLQAAQLGLSSASGTGGLVEARAYDDRNRLNQIAYDGQSDLIIPEGPVIFVEGAEQTSGSTSDTGSVRLTVNGIAATVTYGSASTPESIAAALVTAFNSINIVVQKGQPVPDEPHLAASGNMIFVTPTQPGTATFPFSSSISYNSTVFTGPSFTISPSSGSVTGSTAGGSSYTAPLYSTAISYAPDNVVLGLADSAVGTWNYQYDPMNRLQTAAASQGTYAGTNIAGANLSWGYDRNGNRWNETVTGTSAFPSSWAKYNTSNRVTSSNTAPSGYVYDQSGNVLNDGVNQYLYDAEDHLCAVENGLTHGYTGYIYDAGGNRVAKGSLTSLSCDLKTNGFATLRSYILDQNGQQLYEMDGSGNWQHTNVFVGGQILATYDATAVHFYLADWLGTKRGQASVKISGTTATATAEQTCWSLPFGDDLVCSGSGTDATEHHFAGRQRDTESGLDYMHARYYSSATGRFMNPDPSGLTYADPTNPQSLNLYSYGLNDPLIVIDPSGLDPCAPNLPPSDVTDQSTPLVITQGNDASGNAIGTQTVCVNATVSPDPIPDVVTTSTTATLSPQTNYTANTTTADQNTVGCSAISGATSIISGNATTNSPTIAAGAAIGEAIAGPPGAFAGGIIGSFFGFGGTVSYVPSTKSIYAGPTVVFAPALSGGSGVGTSAVSVPPGQNPNSIANGLSYSITFQPLPFLGSTVIKSAGNPPVIGPSVGTRVPVSFSVSFNFPVKKGGC